MMWRLRRRHASEQTGTMRLLVGGEFVEVSRYVTVREIRAGLPAHLVEEFNEMVETTPVEHLRFYLPEWALPADKLLTRRREYAETLYRSVCVDPFNVDVPTDLDVDAVIRNLGYVSEEERLALEERGGLR